MEGLGFRGWDGSSLWARVWGLGVGTAWVLGARVWGSGMVRV